MSKKSPTEEGKPEKPINIYLKFRSQKLEEYKDRANKIDLANKDWKNLDQKIKDKMKAEYDAANEVYLKALEAFKDKNKLKR